MKIANDNNSWMMSTSDKLFQAIEMDNFWMVHVILKSDDDLKATNNEGLSAIEYALKLGRKKMWDYLRSKGAR